MQRGVYFDAWFPRQHCYHPSLPPRRLRMVDDLVDYRATLLVWAAMGGGSLSLPYLEQEAFGDVGARSRFYGFVNDSEFIAECHKHGIKVFGIVFEAQGWEFPVELNEAEDRCWRSTSCAARAPRLDGAPGVLPEPLPEAVEAVRALLPRWARQQRRRAGHRPDRGVLSRDIHQEPCHAQWVECPDREHRCYYMDRNNPVWREYLKAVIRIQIDAGVDGIQLDEAELPIGAMQYGACFCKDCMKGSAPTCRPGRRRAAGARGVDLAAFHYGELAAERGLRLQGRPASHPAVRRLLPLPVHGDRAILRELADYARAYGRSRAARCSSPATSSTSTRTTSRSPTTSTCSSPRCATRPTGSPSGTATSAGFAGDKDVVVVENPYGGVVPELVEAARAAGGTTCSGCRCSRVRRWART